jgi:hypothetical protein
VDREGAIAAPVLGFATSDCERFGHGWLGQPANALTSLAFGVVGLWILLRAVRGRDRHGRMELAVFGVVVSANALGSFAYHGFQPWWGHWAHDAAILAVLLFIGVLDAALLLGWRRARTLSVFGAGLVGLGIWLALLPDATDLLFAGVTIGACVGEFGACRTGYRPHPSEGWTPRTIGWTVVVVALVLGTASLLLGRTGSPACRPESLVQLHGLWHLFLAVAMGAYAYGAIESRSPVKDPRSSDRRSLHARSRP